MMEDSNTWPLAHQVCTNQWWSVSNERHLLKIDTCGDMTRVKSFPATRDGIDGSQIAQNLWMIFCGQGSWDPALIMPQKGFMDLRINFGQLYQLLYSTSHKQKIPEKWEIYKYAKYGENIIELPSWKYMSIFEGIYLNRFKLEQCLIPKLFVFTKKGTHPKDLRI